MNEINVGILPVNYELLDIFVPPTPPDLSFWVSDNGDFVVDENNNNVLVV